VQHERGQPERVVAMEVGEKDSVDVTRVDADPIHVRKQRSTAVEQQPAIDHHRAVVPVERKRCAGAEERELYAMVTDGFRYTS